MAYGMRPEELAAVGRNVNEQGVGLDESSIQAAMDAELKEDRKDAVARQKKKASASRSKTAQNKADMRNAIIQTVADVGLQAGTAAASSGGSGNAPKSERVAARAERAGQRGNVARQARLQDRSSALKGKEDIRVAAQQTKLNQKLANQKSKAATRAADPKMQKKLDEYKVGRKYGDVKGLGKYKKRGLGPETDTELLGLYSTPGDLYGGK
jgi:undecaprenyl pyrophosphate synthase